MYMYTMQRTETDTENVLQNTETYLGPCPTSKMELFTKIVNSQKALTIFVKHFILDV